MKIDGEIGFDQPNGKCT